ncbi:Interferon_alpha-inducible protein IFI6/IFI27-like [Hexamita inflata]|uniref:Interferon_alpha-inducible protein IFI6/IFI27-like n=1 Tax=Hexamita inflata TaxID=28002 RepID=A0ABP1H2S2_9EUKA
MMSGCAIANGGGVPIGSVVSIFQSIGTGVLSPLVIIIVVIVAIIVIVGVTYIIYEHYKE